MRAALPVLLLAALLGAGLPAAERLRQVPSVTEPDYLKNNQRPKVLAWVHPEYPPDRQAGGSEFVVVGVIIDEAGRPVDPEVRGGPEKFHAPALAAIRQWRFTPALAEGKPTRIEMLVRFEFIPAGPPRGKKPDWPPYGLSFPEIIPAGEPAGFDPPYPPHLAERRLAGVVGLAASIDPTGRVDGVKIADATHPDFLAAALAAVAEWRCTPARQGRIPQPGLHLAEMRFDPVDESGRSVRRDWLERNGIHLRAAPGITAADYFDGPVVAVRMVDPVYPGDPAGTPGGGTARVAFRVGLDGRVTAVRIEEASEDEFGRSLAAAIAAWRFEPLSREGRACGADFTMTWRFEPPDPPPDQPVDARQLDRPLHPLFVRPPVRPESLRDTDEAGEAKIEVLIDRDGRVRRPLIRESSHEELGWAAATAVSQWLFETPRREGRPVAVRAVIPVKFAAPGAAAGGGSAR